MAKRFGRNQKRKMTERIKLLEAINNNMQRHINVLIKKNEMLNSEVDKAMKILEIFKGVKFSCFSEAVNVRSDSNTPYLKVAKEYHNNVEFVGDLNEKTIYQGFALSLEYVDIDALEIDVHREPFNDMMHCILHWNGGANSAYAISRKGLLKMPAKVIAINLVEKLQEQIKKKVSRNGD